MRQRVLQMAWAAILCAAAAVPLGAQSPDRDLQQLVQTPAVSGYENQLTGQLERDLARWKPQKDELGDVIVTLGSGAPRRLIVAPIDEPGFVVSAITPDGYLRVQQLPQFAPNAVFDELASAEPVTIRTAAGRAVTGVVAGPSIHLQGGLPHPVHVTTPDQIYIDIGADSAAAVRHAGVDLLDPVSLDFTLFSLGPSKLAGMGVGDRFGAAALLEVLRHLDAGKIQGTLILAFTTQQWVGGRGLERVLDRFHPDELLYIGPAMAARGPANAAEAPTKEPGAGVLLLSAKPEAPAQGLGAEFEQLAAAHQIPLTTDFSVSPEPPSYLPPPAPPAGYVHLAIPVAWLATPAEMIDSSDLAYLAELLEQYLQGSSTPPEITALPSPVVSEPARPKTAPAIPVILKTLVETYGVSGHEGPVREAVSRLLPPWAKPETDSAGNLILKFTPAPGTPKTPSLLFVAHTDEIGFEVKSIAADGRLEVAWRGGGDIEYFIGHPVLVFTGNGALPGVMELPQGWQRQGLPTRPQRNALYRVDIGARSADAARALGVRVGDMLTIPKKYRPLLGTRASARSFDDRVGDTSLIAAAWALGPDFHGNVTFVWSTEEELGLYGAAALASRLAKEGRAPDYVFAIDTFVSSDSPLESKRFADAPIGHGFVIRAVDNSSIVPLDLVERMVRLARSQSIPVQYGITGGGNDGSAFLRYGSIDVALGWPLRYSHSPGEVIDTLDVDALARAVSSASRSWH